jgi:hypothetical protein
MKRDLNLKVNHSRINHDSQDNCQIVLLISESVEMFLYLFISLQLKLEFNMI